MTHHDTSNAPGAKAPGVKPHGKPTRELEKTKQSGLAAAEPDFAATAAQDPITYEAGWDSTAGVSGALLGAMVYAWWLFIGGTLEILFGGLYLGTAQEAKFSISADWASLIYVVIGVLMVTIAFGILRLERWVYWAGWLAASVLGALSIVEIVRWVQGTPIATETAFFDGLNVLFCLYAVFFLSQADTRKTLHFRAFEGSPMSPGMALCGVALAVPALAVTLVVNHIDKHLSDPTLLLVYLLGSVLVIVMAFMGVKVRSWVWWADLGAAAILTGLSLYVIVDQLRHAIRNTSVDTQGLIFAGVNLVFVAITVYYLSLDEIRGTVFGAHRKQALFSPRTLIGGLTLAVLAAAIYLLEGSLGAPAISYTVFGLVMGTVVGLLPGADPANRISAYFAGLLLAFGSYVARGGLLPYTKTAAGLVVLLMLLVVTGVTAVVRSRAWFVLMLLGVGTMYGLVELQFQAAPSAYLASAGLAFVGILLGFGLGFTVSSLFELELVPYKSPVASQTSPASSSAPRESVPEGTQATVAPG
jgi:hypothetical protein